MFKYITHRPLWVNILIGILLALALFFLLLLSLKWVTKHGDASSVPSVTGKTYDEARELLRDQGFEVEIHDSIYVDTVPPLTVIRQIPDADEVVKANRTVYLVINRAVPPLVEMPNLLGYSFRNAEMSLNNFGLRIGDTIYRPDFAKNAVLEQIHEGRSIAPGTRIRRGSVISLVLGTGVKDEEFIVPSITGMRFCDARAMLAEYGISIGAIVPDPNVEDTCNGYIYRQNPERFDEDKRIQRIRSGQTMDVWLSVDRPVKDSTGDNEAPLVPESPDDPIFAP
jgi:beta-lactam-binding protein with PASTA domain